EPLIDQRANVLLAEVRAAYQLQAAQRSVRTVEPVVTAAEREAAGIVVDVVPQPPGQRGASFRRGAASGPSLPDEFNAELSLLLPKKMTALEIRDFLSGEFTPLPMEEVMAVLRAREASGQVTLTPRRGR
ncbi:MAG TPA: hypothetical protein VIQ60_08735, partial [Gemmatimonadaceae bacterium]